MLCCVCLLDNPKNMGIFDDNGQQLEVAEIIYKYLWFKVIDPRFSETQLRFLDIIAIDIIYVCI